MSRPTVGTGRKRPRIRIILDKGYFMTQHMVNGKIRVKSLVQAGVEVRLSKHWPKNLQTVVQEPPQSRRRGPDGLFGSGETPLIGGQARRPGQSLPTDIANRQTMTPPCPAARWVHGIVESQFSVQHGKMLWTEKGALLGSSNWSDHSERCCFELDVFLQTEKELAELHQMFELMWAAAAAPDHIMTIARLDAIAGGPVA